jgi:CO/xanthine dehydrogenase Mo-binding subunit
MAERLYRDTLPAGRGRGIGFARYKNQKTYCAVGIELELTDAAEVKLHRAVVAADAGEVVDPDGLAAQLEGGVIQAASWTLYEEVKFDRDGITSRDWDSYPILRFDNVPEIESIILPRPGDPFLGAGEASSGPTGAAIANALREAAGLRLRRLPFTPQAIRAAALAG